MKYALGILFYLPFFLTAQVSNNMTLLDQWNPEGLPTSSGVKFNDVWGYTDNLGKEYAIVGSAAFIHIVDVTNPTDVVEIDRIEGGNTTVWRDFKTYRDRIYAVSDNSAEGLIIMDASYLPDSVHVTSRSNQFFDRAHNIFIDEAHGRLYVAGTNTQSNGLIVLDISQTPDVPKLITQDDLRGGEYVHDLYVNDHIVYASHGWNGLYIWDYTDPSNIRRLAQLQTNGYNHSSWLTEDYRHLVYAEEIPSGVDMGVIDVTNLYQGDIELVHLFEFPLLAPEHTNPTPHNPYIMDTMLVVSYYDDGTQVFNIGDPLDVQPYAYYDTYENTSYVGNGNWGTYPYLTSGNIISTDIQNGLFVMRIDDYDFTTINYTPEFAEVELTIGPDYINCSGAPAVLTASGGYQFYQWFRDGIVIQNQSSNEYTATEPGVYLATGLQGQKKISSEEFQFNKLDKPSLVIQGNTIDAIPNEGTFDWFLNGEKIDQKGDGSYTITPSSSGYYQAEQTIDGCMSLSDSVYFFAPRTINNVNLDGLHARYLQSSKQIELSIQSNEPIDLLLNIYNSLGQTMNQKEITVDGFNSFYIESSNLSTGVYFVTVDNGKEQDSYKLYVH